MKILTTPSELIELGVWNTYCELSGTNIYAVNEGLMSGDERIEVDAVPDRAGDLDNILLESIKISLANRDVMGENPNSDVHTRHCCLAHGCKYGYEDGECSVMSRTKKQDYKCTGNHW